MITHRKDRQTDFGSTGNLILIIPFLIFVIINFSICKSKIILSLLQYLKIGNYKIFPLPENKNDNLKGTITKNYQINKRKKSEILTSEFIYHHNRIFEYNLQVNHETKTRLWIPYLPY
jgi:hypothetical protein